jgi:hypothetical protein
VLRVPPLRLSGVAFVCLLVAIFAVGLRPNTDPDLWWHLATGRYMAAHHLIPHHDVFSLTARSHRWITHEWVSELLFYGLWRLGGMPLLSLFTACIITCTFGLVCVTARLRGAPALLAAAVTLLATLVAAHTWGTGTRPQMFSLLLSAIYALALARMVVRREPAPPIWIPLLMVVWVNLHGGFIFGLALLGLATAGYVADDLLLHWRPWRSWRSIAPDERPRPLDEPYSSYRPATTGSQPEEAPWDQVPALSTPGLRLTDAATSPPGSPGCDHVRDASRVDIGRCALVVAATALATLINPNGLAGALYPLSYLGNNASTRYIQEWLPPDFHQVSYQLFAALVALLAVGVLARLRRLRLIDLLVLAPFTYLAFQSVRNIGLFAVLATPVAAELLGMLLPAGLRRRRRPGVVAPAKVVLNWLCVGCLAVGVGFTIVPSIKQQAQDRAVAKTFPARALAFIGRHGLPARGLDSYDWGGYLIWQWYPTRSVYVDGRPDMYGDAFMDRYVRALRGDAGWQQLLRANALCYVLVQPSTGIAHALAAQGRWILRYRDAKAVLYLAPAQTPGCPAP